MAAVRNDLRVDAAGLRVFAKQLRALSPRLGLAETQALRAIGDKVRDEIRTTAKYPFLTGELRRSFKTSATQRGVGIYSLLPQAPVLEWGGEIQPRGYPITFKRSEFVGKTVESHNEEIVADLGVLLDDITRRYAEFV